MRRNTIKVILAIGDYAVMIAAMSVMLLYRYGLAQFTGRFEQHIYTLSAIFFLWLISFYVLEMYNINAPFAHRKFSVAMFANVAIAITVLYLFLDLVEITPRRNLAILVVVFIPLFYLWRYVFTKIIDNLSIAKSVAIIGSDRYAIEMAQEIEKQKRQGFRVVAIVKDEDKPVPQWVDESTIRVFDNVTAFKECVPTLRVDTVIVSDSWYSSLYAQLYELIPMRIQFFQLTSFWERFLECIPIYSTQESWFLENLNRGPGRGYNWIKRIVDVVVVVVFLPIILAVSALTAALVRLSSPGPILFSQTRVGRNEQHYTIYKFRSMYTNAERNGAQWASERDPRITPIGRFLRATRLDEIPQLFNVLIGDMSIIGPRPERPEFVNQLAKEIPHYHLRHLVRPGLTGWAQVRYRYGASTEDSAVKLTYDLYYVKNISFVLDIKIALKTIMTILGRQGR